MSLYIFLFIYHTAAKRFLVGLSLKDLFFNSTSLKDEGRLKQPSHDKLKLANSCWQTQVGVCKRHNNCWQLAIGGHGFDSRRGLRFFLCPTLVSC